MKILLICTKVGLSCYILVSSNSNLLLALRVEWAKCKARASRWREEIMLIEEEMRRVIAFGYWKVDWWHKQVGRRSDVEDPLLESLRAYAAEHAHLELTFAEKVDKQWAGVRERAKLVLAGFGNGVHPDSIPATVIEVEVELDEEEI